MTILLVDDRDENLYMLETLLKNSGYNVLKASNGLKALEILKKNKIDLIISDIFMPVMDGFQLCYKVKTDKELHSIPFIIHTATYTEPKDEEFAAKIGADSFIIKPCEPQFFLEKITEVMADSQNSDYGSQPALPEKEILQLYNERLVSKLERKVWSVRFCSRKKSLRHV